MGGMDAQSKISGSGEPAFELLQTLRLHSGECRHLEQHLDRLAAASAHFGFPFERDAVRVATADAVRNAGMVDARVRIRLNCRGRATVDLQPVPPTSRKPLAVQLASCPICAPAAFLRHKTSRRGHYDPFYA